MPFDSQNNSDDSARVKELENAFAAFTEVSEQLESSYKELEKKVNQLTVELAEARSEELRHLKEKERIANRLDLLLSLLPGGIIVLDKDGFITDYNPGAEQLLTPPLDHQPWQDIIDKSFISSNDRSGEVMTNSGLFLNISTTSMGEEPGSIILLKDVTETRNLQESLNVHKRLSAMGEMAASLAHQIRTPLTTALLYASHLTSANIDDQKRLKFAEKTVSRLRHLESIIKDMLLFAKGGKADTTKFPLSTLITSIKTAMENELEQADCKLAIEIDGMDDKTMVTGNYEAISSAMQNLIHNSINICNGKISIILKAQRKGDNFILSITDNGPGINADIIDHIFDPFFTTRARGTGLGLAVVQSVAIAHGGTTWAESTGDGTTIGLRLPIDNINYNKKEDV